MYPCQRQAGIYSENRKNALLEMERGCTIFLPAESMVSALSGYKQ